jgi:hypothetical protein
MTKLKIHYINVQFSPQITHARSSFKAAAPTKAACDKDGHQGCGEGIGFIDFGAMATGRGVMLSIAERAFLSYSSADVTGVTQFSSSVSSDGQWRHESTSNAASPM